jgi:hypothetical protein
MKWMIVMVVFGTQPVKTDLMFNTLGECRTAIYAIQKQIADEYNETHAWAKKQDASVLLGDLKRWEEVQMRALGMKNAATCIPHRP